MAIKISAKSIRSLLVVAASVVLLLANIPVISSTDPQVSSAPNSTSEAPSLSTTITAATVTTTTSTTTTTAAAAATSNQPTPNVSTNLSTQQPSNTATAATTTATTTTTTTSVPSTTISIEEAKQVISRHIHVGSAPNRLAMNKPRSTQMVDFAPDSIEALVSQATTQFGLNFIKNSLKSTNSNLVISPLSLQNLLNMILLGATDNSTSQRELAQVLGYDKTGLLSVGQTSYQTNRLKPHEAMHNVFENILSAIHLSVRPATSSSAPINTGEADLLNTNIGPLKDKQDEDHAEGGKIKAHLQTSNKDLTPISGQVKFNLANLILTNEDRIELKPDYEKSLKTYYNANFELFSRKKSSNTISKKVPESPLHERVNNWVKNMTQNQIDKLVGESDLSSDDLVMVLLNAAHFKGRWLRTFHKGATHEKPFYNNGNEREATNAMFMRKLDDFGYADFGSSSLGQSESVVLEERSHDAETLLRDDTCVMCDKQNSSSTSARGGKKSATPPVIELSKEEARRLELAAKLNCSVLMLPFSLNDGQELSMVILLPTERDGIGALQDGLDAPTLNEIYKSLSEQHVQVELPRFSFQDSHDAKASLLKMGLSSIFNNAKLDRMFDTKNPGGGESAYVNKIIHKAKITVDESGAEAAAVSAGMVYLRTFIRPPAPLFSANHPFLFIIRHNRSNMPLFMGRVSSL